MPVEQKPVQAVYVAYQVNYRTILTIGFTCSYKVVCLLGKVAGASPHKSHRAIHCRIDVHLHSYEKVRIFSQQSYNWNK